MAAYDAAIAAAREMGAVTTHASFTARRYEEFETFEAFNDQLRGAPEVGRTCRAVVRGRP